MKKSSLLLTGLMVTAMVLMSACGTSDAATAPAAEAAVAEKADSDLVFATVVKSIAYGIRHNLEEMRQEGVQAHRILAVGGGTRNPAWMQIVSDVAGINMEIPAQQIGASYGDAFMAGIGAGVFTDYRQIHQWIKLDQEIIPDQGNVNIYDLNYSIYRDLYDQTANLMHKLR